MTFKIILSHTLLFIWYDVVESVIFSTYQNYTTPDDESIDLKLVEKCEECKHIGTRTKIVVCMTHCPDDGGSMHL
jgi:hypothetical protein